MNRYLLVALALAAGAVLIASTVSVTMALPTNQSVAQTFGMSMKFKDYKDGVFKVMAGGGGPTAPLTKFFPSKATIKVGESVTWINPSRVGEPHNVAFALNQTQGSEIDAPFIINNSTEITPLAPGNSEPLTFTGPNGTTVMVGANARAYIPTVIAADGSVTHLPPNANYTMDGTEQYINSGFIWPKGMSPPGLAPIDTFTIKFEKAGTYDYGCSIHPWMRGEVVVS
jgi:plastocyanin